MKRKMTVLIIGAVTALGLVSAGPAAATGYWAGPVPAGYSKNGSLGTYRTCNWLQNSGGGWDIGFSRTGGTWQNTGTVVSTDFYINNNYPAMEAHAWLQNKNAVQVQATGNWYSTAC